MTGKNGNKVATYTSNLLEGKATVVSDGAVRSSSAQRVVFYLPHGHQLLTFQNCSKCVFYYKNYRFDLLENRRFPSSLSIIGHRLKKISPLEHPEHPRVWHFFYEWGHYYNDLVGHIGEDDLLAIELEFQKVQKQAMFHESKFSLGPILFPSFSDYKESFLQVQKHLRRGDCYQVNLAFPFSSSFHGPFEGLLSQLWKGPLRTGAYAHATHFSCLAKSFMSQSPECLFQMRKRNGQFYLQSMPIKGSLPLLPGDCVNKKWRELVENEKDEGELFMVIDLLRNDLNRIEWPRAKVLKKKVPLIVPGILHQYALIEVALSRQVTLDKIMSSLFPGGSITGPPKRRVMDIVNYIEQEKRGLYCGTTFIQYRNIFCGNINIRTAEIEHGLSQLKYFAGGGITLLSQLEDEYREMLLKADSFFKLLGKKSQDLFR